MLGASAAPVEVAPRPGLEVIKGEWDDLSLPRKVISLPVRLKFAGQAPTGSVDFSSI